MSVPVPVAAEQSAPSGQPVNPQEYAARTQARYVEERNKRANDEGRQQYIDLIKSDKFKNYASDPWIDRSVPGKRPPTDKCKVLILGAGYTALLFGVRLIERGFDAKDIFFVDSAGGFGGTWYWNRYPGLMCDVESYIYMPLLEETGYMPKHKYAYGPELRAHANRIAEKWNLTDQLIPSSTIKDSTWDDSSSTWRTTISLDRFDGEKFTITSDFLLLASGVLNVPKIPSIKDIDLFKGHIFHTARFDYDYCGGSPEDQSCPNLKDKRIAIIGTGATAIQLVPALASKCASLTVVQRTPSAVDVRGQRETDPSEWQNSIASKPGWQAARIQNFIDHQANNMDGDITSPNLVDDGWTHFPSYAALPGGPFTKGLNMENIGPYIAKVHAMDFPRQERIRARVDESVHDKTTAEALKPWYPGWCKRPCFHDEYLPAFNQPNVRLADTQGAGVERFTARGLVVDGAEHEVDAVVMATGFNSPGVGNPGSRAGVRVTGRAGLTMDAKWDGGVATLHGLVSRGLPNCFFAGLNQAGHGVNYTSTVGVFAAHVAHIMAEAVARGAKVVVEPTEQAEMGWTYRVMPQAIGLAVLSGCTPSYLNGEGAADREMSDEQKQKGARSAPWHNGLTDYERVLREWREDGKLEGLEIQVKA